MSTLIPLVTKKVFSSSQEFLKKELGYDFFNLIVKLVVYFVAAWFLDQYIKAVAGQQNIVARIIGNFGGIIGYLISVNIIEYFTKPELHKVPYWTVVKGVAMFLVLLEAKNYYELNESDNRKPSPLTLGVFAIILAILGFMTFPDIMEKLKTGNIMKGIGK